MNANAPATTEPVVLQTYVLQLIGRPEGFDGLYIYKTFFVPGALREAEENLTDLLPTGYSVRIREWDEEQA